MSKVLFFNLPQFGHINPTLGLVNEIVRQGDEVIYCATKEFETAVSSAGARVHLYDPYFSMQFQKKKVYGSIITFINYLADLTEQLLEGGFVEDVRRHGADYVISDRFSPWGIHIAQHLGLPYICSIPTLALFNWRVRFQNIRNSGIGYVLPLKDFGKMFRFFQKMNRISSRHGCRVRSMIRSLGKLNIVYTSRYFQPYSKFYDDRYVFIGPSVDQRGPTEKLDLPSFADAVGKKLVYISLGTIFNQNLDFYRTCFSALADSNCIVLVSTGGEPPAGIAKEAPSNFVVRRFVPQLEVLKKADLFVTHGGTNSVHEALLYRVPLIVVPQGADSFLLGWRVEKLGAGIMLKNRDFRAANLKQAVNEILSDAGKRESCEKISRSFTEAGGYRKAWERISAFKEMNGVR